MEQKSFVQLRKVLFNNAVKKEEMDFVVEFIVILINGSIILVATVHTLQEKRLFVTWKSAKRRRKF